MRSRTRRGLVPCMGATRRVRACIRQARGPASPSRGSASALRDSGTRFANHGGESRTPRMNKGLQASELLRQEHAQVEALFARYENTTEDSPERARLLSQIAMALSVHMRVQEEVFHPAARAALDADGRELLDEAAVENVSQKYFLIELITSYKSDRLFQARIKVIRKHFRHHVREEEQRILPLLDSSRLDQAALGLQIVACREAMLAAAAGEVEEQVDD